VLGKPFVGAGLQKYLPEFRKEEEDGDSHDAQYGVHYPHYDQCEKIRFGCNWGLRPKQYV